MSLHGSLNPALSVHGEVAAEGPAMAVTPPLERKLSPWNANLPYADAIPAEAVLAFESIKRGLTEVVATRELVPGLKFWCQRLEQ